MKLAWVTDSASSIDADFAKLHNVFVVPLQVGIEGQSYRDMVDITEEEFYHRLDDGIVPTSSQPSLGAFIELYERLQREGYDAVISLHVSSALSGTADCARMAAETLDFPIEIIDSGLIAKPMLFVLEEGLRLYEDSKAWTQREIVDRMCKIREKVVGYFIVNDLRYLHRGGRLSTSSTLIGCALKIKPVLHFAHQVFDVIAKVRTYRKAKEFLNTLLEEDASKHQIKEINVVHANHLGEAQQWVQQLTEKFKDIPVSISTLGVAVGVHSGPGAIGMAWRVE